MDPNTQDELPCNMEFRRRPSQRSFSMQLPNIWARATCYGEGVVSRRELSNAIVDRAHGFPYSRKLEAHKSCVNSLAFSSGDGRFLATGGDDPRICLWDFHQEDVKKPSFALRGVKGNIFSLAFSATNKYLFSAGTFEQILKYDVAHIGSTMPSLFPTLADHVFRDHTDSIRAVTCHPTHDELFMSAGEDGTIRRHDCREPHPSTPTQMQNFIATENEVTSVQYHPTIDNLFITSDGYGGVFLRDSRMAFGSMQRRSGEGIVQRYNTKLTKKSAKHLSNPESSSVTFDRDGSKIAVTFTHYLPTIYSVSDPNPVAILSGQRLPDGTRLPPRQRGYSNSCTMKHGTFGGPGLDIDDMYAGGSDDFHAYIWKIPSLRRLQEQRRTIQANEWDTSDSPSIAFTEGRRDPKIIPVEISTPLCRLTGHNSIVNTVVFHPHFLHVVTAGVEKAVFLHSPTPSSPCTENLPLSPLNVRQLDDANAESDRVSYLSALLGLGISVDSSEDSSERQTLSLFDSIIRSEGDADVFERRKWRSPDSSDLESEKNSDEEEEGTQSEEDFLA